MANEYTNTRPSKVSVGNVDFLPGETKEMHASHLEALEKKVDGKHTHPLRRGDKPILQKGSVTMPNSFGPSAASTLEGLDQVKALAQIRLCSNLEVLAGWHAAEKRPEIINAINARGKDLTDQKA